MSAAVEHNGGGGGDGSTGRASGLPFEYLVMLDFEATCDNAHPPAVTKEEAEIIEFPWVVVNTATLQVVHKEQYYVAPQKTALTSFCSRLTGITQEQVAHGVKLQEAVQRFDAFARQHFQWQNKSYCFVTHGRWDLCIQLAREAGEKGIALGSHYTRFFDLKEEFDNYLFSHPEHVPQRPRGRTIPDLCAALGLEVSGRLHSGLDDCMSMASIVCAMLRSGAPGVFRVPVDEDAVRRTFLASNSCIVHLRGLPYSAGVAEVVQWYEDKIKLKPSTVNILHTSDGRPSGSAFAVFSNHDKAVRALALNGRVLGGRYVEVLPSNEQEMETEGAFLAAPARGADSARLARPRKFLPGDWQCGTCSFHNFARQSECKKCGSSKRQTNRVVSAGRVLPGDWLCVNEGCGFHNFARQSNCKRCGAEPVVEALGGGGGGTAGGGTAGGGESGSGSETRRPENGRSSHAQRSAGSDSRLSSGGAGGNGSRGTNGRGGVASAELRENGDASGQRLQRNGKKGPKRRQQQQQEQQQVKQVQQQQQQQQRAQQQKQEETKHHHHHQQQHQRVRAREASVERSDEEVKLSNEADVKGMTEEEKEAQLSRARSNRGDWYCPSCNFRNFSRQMVCKKCAVEPPGGARESHSGRHPAAKVRKSYGRVLPGDWVCASASCGFHNFARQLQCRKCGAARNDGKEVHRGAQNEGDGDGDGEEMVSSGRVAPQRGQHQQRQHHQQHSQRQQKQAQHGAHNGWRGTKEADDTGDAAHAAIGSRGDEHAALNVNGASGARGVEASANGLEGASCSDGGSGAVVGVGVGVGVRVGGVMEESRESGGGSQHVDSSSSSGAGGTRGDAQWEGGSNRKGAQYGAPGAPWVCRQCANANRCTASECELCGAMRFANLAVGNEKRFLSNSESGYGRKHEEGHAPSQSRHAPSQGQMDAFSYPFAASEFGGFGGGRVLAHQGPLQAQLQSAMGGYGARDGSADAFGQRGGASSYGGGVTHVGDWVCTECRCHNFWKRSQCMKCGSGRE